MIAFLALAHASHALASSWLNSGNILAAAAVVGLLITAAAVAGGSFRVGRNTAAVNAYKEAAEGSQVQVESQKGTIQNLQQALVHQKTEMTALLSERDRMISELQGRIAVLEDMVSGRALLEQMAAGIEAKAAEALAQYGIIRSDIRSLREKVDQIAIPPGGD